MQIDRKSAVDLSIVIPAYNAASTILRTLQAVQRQTVLPDEILVIDDGSTDDTAACVESLGDTRIRLIRQANQGVSAARNRGIAEACSSLIAFCDADDMWSPGFIATILMLQESYPEAVAYASAYRVIPPDAPERDAVAQTLPFGGRHGLIDDYFRIACYSAPPINSSAVAITKEVLQQVGGFPVGVIAGEDLLTWARVALNGPIAYSREVLSSIYCPARLNFSRSCDPLDPVGAELKTLYLTASAKLKPSLRRYLARWHEMQCIIALGQQNQALARHHACLNLHFQGMNIRGLGLAWLACMPRAVAEKIFFALRSM